MKLIVVLILLISANANAFTPAIPPTPRPGYERESLQLYEDSAIDYEDNSIDFGTAKIAFRTA